MTNKLLPIIFASGALSLASSQAATLIDWDFSGLDWSSGGSSGLVTNDLAPDPLLTSSASNAAAGLTSTDLTPSPNMAVVVTANTMPGEADLRNFDIGGDGINDHYIEFTITGNVAGSLNIDSISISEWRNGGGAANGMAFDVNIDGGGYSLYDAVQVDSNSGDQGFDTFTFTEAIAGASSVGIRFTPRNAGQGTTGDIHINGLTVEGNVIPEPSSLAMVGLGCLALLRRRRRV